MTAEEVKRLDELTAEVKRLRAKLSRLKDASKISAMDYAVVSGSGRTGDPVAQTAVSVVDVEDAILKNILEMVELIDRVPSEKTRKIFRRRYINMWTWAQIADELGYASAQGPRKRMKGYKMAVSVASTYPKDGVK